MGIESKIKEIVKSKFPEYGFVLDDWNGIDRAVDKVYLPAIVVFLVESGSLTFKNGRCRDAEDIIFALIDKVPNDADGEENTGVCQPLKQDAKTLIMGIQGSGYFEPISEEVEYSPVYEVLASNVTGIIFNLRLKEAIGSCI